MVRYPAFGENLSQFIIFEYLVNKPDCVLLFLVGVYGVFDVECDSALGAVAGGCRVLAVAVAANDGLEFVFVAVVVCLYDSAFFEHFSVQIRTGKVYVCRRHLRAPAPPENYLEFLLGEVFG